MRAGLGNGIKRVNHPKLVFEVGGACPEFCV
jgi:hypothetical protein